MRSLLIGLTLLILGACATNPAVRWAQQQQLANDIMSTLVAYRAPCVDTAAYPAAGPDHPLCRVTDDTWLYAKTTMYQADSLLQKADRAAQLEEDAGALLYLRAAEAFIWDLQRLVTSLEEVDD